MSNPRDDTGEPAAEGGVATYGSWRSPITAHLIAEGGVSIMWPQSVGEALYWTEMRPLEDGRYVVVRRGPEGDIADVTPAGVSARTLVHEYGGGMYAAFRNERSGESVLFSGHGDQRLYRQDLETAGGDAAGGAETGSAGGGWSAPRPVTPAPPAPRAHRYADGRATPNGRLFVSVRERHEADGSVVNELVSLPTDGSAAPRVIASGHDFYAAPRISPDGRRLAWLTWDHPRMPWDGTHLWVAGLADDGTLRGKRLVAGGLEESVLQPIWSPDGELQFASDRTGWWNLYLAEAGPASPAGPRDDTPNAHAGGPPQVGPPHARSLAPRAAEFAKAPWVFGLRHSVFLADGTRIVCFTEDGRDHLAVVEAGSPAAPGQTGGADTGAGAGAENQLHEIASPYTVVYSLTPLGDRLGIVAGSHTEGLQAAVLDPRTGECEVVRRGRPVPVDPAYISRPKAISFPTDGGLTAHANYYPPANRDFVAPEGERPPLLVISHGGPTSAHEAILDLDVQYWTSRGFAVVDVNYGGSTGYGREYRERLRHNWGIVDTVDCINAARYLIERGDADPERVGVRGGSAGGYTTLNALTRFEFFTAGASLFGLADLEEFAAGGTHKFESRYLDSMVGPYPEQRDVYRERSPIDHVDGISCPVILLQGLEDVIVPPRQAEIIVEALKAKHLPYAYVAFEGEQHGFRKAANIVRAQEAELYFYGRVWGFTPADEIEPVQIENLE
jgi:dipeptidyl aminopeptidase/acylaminoacyl peptidase